MESKVTKAQLGRLMTVYSQLAARTVGMSNTRESRMAWAAHLLHRDIDSFSTLTLSEATRLIDQAQGQLGHVAPLKRVRSARDAKRAGVDGRKCASAAEFDAQPEIVSQSQAEMIDRFRLRLDWTRENFESWLGSRSSPLRGRKQIRTTADANKVIFGLKGMLHERGLWNERAA